jgi:hypothetical protein
MPRMATRPTPEPEARPANQAAGISNRESPAEEARERQAHPPVDTSGPPAEDASGRTGDEPGGELTGQTSHKAGSRSIAQKEGEARYPDREAPPSKHVAGAFGKEPTEQP